MRLLDRNANSRHRFLRGVSTLAAGTMGGQLIVLGLAPVLTRLYRPDDFGLLAVFASVLALCTVVATLRYELALPVVDKAEVNSLLGLILGVLTLATISAGLFLPLVGADLLGMLNAASLLPYFWLLAIGVAFAGLLQMLTYLRIRDQKYGQLAASRLVQAVATTVAQIGLAATGPIGLLLGYVGGRLAGVALLVRGPQRPVVAPSHMIRSAIRYRRYPLLTMWASFINTLGLQLPNFVLAAAYGPSIVGLFSLTIRVIQTPTAMLGQAVAQVFLGNLSEARQHDAVSSYSRRTFSTLSLLALAPAGLAMVWAPDGFSFVFGGDWRGAGEMAVYLIPWIALAFIGQPLTSLAFALGGQAIDLSFQIALAAGRLTALGLGVAASGEPLLAVQAFGFTSAAVWAFYILWLMRLSGVPLWDPMRRFCLCAFAGVLVASPVGVARFTGTDGTGMAAASLLSCVLLVVILGADLRGGSQRDAR